MAQAVLSERGKPLSPRSLERWLRGLGSLVPREAVACIIEEVHRSKMDGDMFSELVRSRQTPALDGVRASHMATLRRCWRGEYVNQPPPPRRHKSPTRGLAPPPPPPIAAQEIKELVNVMFNPPSRSNQHGTPGKEVKENRMPDEHLSTESRHKNESQKKKESQAPRMNREVLHNPGKRDGSPLRSHQWDEPPRLEYQGHHAKPLGKEGQHMGFAYASRGDQKRIMQYYGLGERFLDVMQKLHTSQIRSRLFIGSMADAAYWPLLEQLRITHVVNVSSEAQQFEPPFERQGISYLLLPMQDSAREAQMLSKNRFEVLKRATKFIRAALRSNARQGACLVHCVEGLSRSAAIVAAFLMEYEGMSVDHAVESVRASHPGALNPNRWQDLLGDFHYHLLRG